jgi:hypothetical protein
MRARTKKYLCLALLPIVMGLSALLWWYHSGSNRAAASKDDNDPTKKLPLTHVVLFNNGVGYFQREGAVEGNARIDMTFPAGDVNDLLKSMLLEDLNGGTISTVNYDSQLPIEHTLKGFMLDLTGNPSFGDLLNQARGEKVEVVPKDNAQGNTLTGTIVGLETTARGTDKESHQLNVKCTEGMRCVPLAQVQRLRFLNAALDNEFQHALDVLAGSHDSLKKMVSLHFLGEGKRDVRIGYVVENPIWKASYRLKVDKDGKVNLQSWAVVENTTDEDWNNVKMALVAGRPISFQMDLYQPLYVPRPTVEPDLFASLRPPVFNGALMGPVGPDVQGQVPGSNIGGFNAGFAGLNAGFNAGFGGNAPMPPQGIAGYGTMNNGQLGRGLDPRANRLTYEELTRRKEELRKAKDEALKTGSAVAAPDGQVQAALEEKDGEDSYQYLIDHAITVPRQKSAMLSLMNQQVSGTRLSIFNEKVQSKYPMLGLKFKNTTGQPLMQGPVMVHEGGRYAGDARIMDMQPNEERFLAYAVDLGMEVAVGRQERAQQVVAAKIAKGLLHVSQRPRLTTTYNIKNRSRQERTLIVEHPIMANRTLVSEVKPIETTRNSYRFEVKVPAGKLVDLDVIEDRLDSTSWSSCPLNEETFRLFANTTNPKIREALKKANDMRLTLEQVEKKFNDLDDYAKYVGADRAMLRGNLERVDVNSELGKKYQEKLLPIEGEFEKLQTRVDEEKQKLRKQQREYENYLAGLNIE